MEPVIRHLDIQTALNILEEAIEDKGSEHVYRNTNDTNGPSGCVYVLGTKAVVEGHNDWGDPIEVETNTDHMEPGCIIGNALIGRGIPMEKFVELGINSETPVDDVISAFETAGLIGSCDFSAIDVLREAQDYQDVGNSWGTAYIKARRAADMYDWSDSDAS